MNKIITKCAGWLAVITSAVYITAVAAAHRDGPGGLDVTGRWSTIPIAVAVLCGTVFLVGWMIRNQGREDAERAAAIVSGAVAAGIEQSLNKVAERSVSRSNDAIIDAMRSMFDELSVEMNTLVHRALTTGMIAQATADRGGNVASIVGRRDT